MKDEKKDNPAAEKSFSSALRIINLCQHLSDRNRLKLLDASKFIMENNSTVFIPTVPN